MATVTTRAPRSSKSAKSQVNSNTLRDMSKSPELADPKGSDERFLERVAHPILVSSIVSAMGSFKTAINLEVAVCLTVFADAGGVDLESKKELYGIYREAGYDCEEGGKGADYKTVNRRINYAAKFFEKLGAGEVLGILGDTRDHAAIREMVNYLTTEYNFRSMNDVLKEAGIEPPSVEQWEKIKALKTSTKAGGVAGDAAPQGTTAKGGTDETGHPLTQEGTPDKRVRGEGEEESQGQQTRRERGLQGTTKEDAGDEGVAAAMAAEGAKRNRRETDSDNWIRAQYNGVTMFIPKDVQADTLMDLGLKLMEMSRKINGKNAAEVLSGMFETEAAH